MRCPLIKRIALFAVMILVSTSVHARIGPPVKIRLAEVSGTAVSGQTMQATIEILAQQDVLLSTFRCEGTGWRLSDFAPPLDAVLAVGESFQLPITAVPTDPDQLLRFSFEYDGHLIEKSFDLSRARRAAAERGGSTRIISDSVFLPGAVSSAVAPLPAWDHDFSKQDDGVPGSKSDRATDDLVQLTEAYSIHVYGRFAYYKPGWPDEIGAHGVTVRVMDEDTGVDEELAVTTTSASGYFDVTFTWDPCVLCDQTPDLYVQFEASNQEVVDVEDSTWEINYRWNTPTQVDFTGTEWNTGSRQPGNQDEYPAVHICTTLTRGWLYCHDEASYTIPHLDVQWPEDGAVSYYSPYWEEIHITQTGQWSENTILHEYGHHWVNIFADWVTPDYCNGICDFGGDCGHCNWCEESNDIAFTEGMPYWFADCLIRKLVGLYDPDPTFIPSFESLRPCDDTGGTWGDPYLTEGIFAALLRDVEDSTQDDTNPGVPGQDALEFGFTQTLAFIDVFEPTTTHQYLDMFMSYYVGYHEPFWETAANVGYDVDELPPPATGDLSSLSHTVGVSSPDATVHLVWTRPVDDASGVAGYAISFSEGGPSLPYEILGVGNEEYYITPILAPGTWYFNLRAVDRAGRWSDDFATFGPVIIRDANPSNLLYIYSFDWSRPLIPHSVPDVVWGGPYIDDPVTLEGDAATTYLNLFAANVGEAGTGIGLWGYCWIDEEWVWWGNWPPLAGDDYMVAMNEGPVTAPPGRHTLHAMLDAEEQIPEVVETDNFEGHQWIWTPYELTAETSVVRNAPPWRDVGWGSVTDGQTLYYNADGFRYTPTSYWQVVYLVPHDPIADYDLRLHQPSTGADNGFGSFEANSCRGPGLLEATIVNGNLLAWQTWDVGVINSNYAAANYGVTYTNSQVIGLDQPQTLSLGQQTMLIMREFSGGPGLYSITLASDDPGQQVNVAWYDSEFLKGNLTMFSASAQTDASGQLLLNIDLPQNGWHGIMVWLDSRDSPLPMEVVLEVYPIRPELYPYAAPGWASPLVPRPAPDATVSHVRMPTELTGDSDSTFFNIGAINDSPTVAPMPVSHVYLDGDDIRPVSIGYQDLLGEILLLNIISYVPISGGRHSLWNFIDPNDLIPEQIELNNVYGEQWVWSPQTIDHETPNTRAAPPWRMGGIDGMTVMEPYYYNCDGLRTSVFVPATPTGYDGWYGAVAMMPGAGDAYDLRLHTTSTGAKDGFASYLAASAWGDDESEFVIANFIWTTDRQFDAGVVAYGTPAADYTIHTCSSRFRGYVNRAPFGPYTLEPYEIVHLHEFELIGGEFKFELRDLGSNVDWGIGLYPNSQAFLGKSDVLPDAMARLNGPGEDESFTYTFPDGGGWYLFAVWKSGQADLHHSASYELEISPTLATADDNPLPARLELLANTPNPFNPATTIRFALPHEEMVNLCIYDQRGRLVRTLIDESRPAGWHEVVWRGDGATGETVASGVYFSVLQTREERHTGKMMLLK